MSLFNFGAKSKLGIDIGTSSIKIVELSKEGGRFKLENYAIFQLGDVKPSNNPEQAITRTGQLTEENLSWALKETIKKSGIRVRDVIASIPSISTFSTIISMPYLLEEDITKSIPFEARKYIPLPPSEVVMDWSIVSVNNDSQKSTAPPTSESSVKQPSVDIFLVAVPKEETKRYQSIMKLSGLNLKALEIENAALIRSMVGNDLSPLAIINIGGRSTSIIVVEGGIERLSHNYEVGSFEVTNSIARALNISVNRAEELKKKFGLKDSPDNTIRSSMISSLDLIVFETKKTIHNYEDLKHSKISSVLVTGGLSNMANFVDYFSAKLGLSVLSGNPLSRVIVKQELTPLKSEMNSVLAVALGLAMREI